jgi:hypothetical protein
VETRGPERIQDDRAGKIELREGVGGENARAVHRVPARRVLLEHHDVESAARQEGRCVQTSGSAADDDYISHPYC